MGMGTVTGWGWTTDAAGLHFRGATAVARRLHQWDLAGVHSEEGVGPLIGLCAMDPSMAPGAAEGDLHVKRRRWAV